MFAESRRSVESGDEILPAAGAGGVDHWGFSQGTLDGDSMSRAWRTVKATIFLSGALTPLGLLMTSSHHSSPSRTALVMVA